MGLVLTQALAIGGQEQTDYPYSYVLSNNQLAGGIDITITNSGGNACRVQWGDGEYSNGTSGVQITHTYGDDFDGDVIIRSESTITEIASTDGGFDFPISALPPTLTSLTVTSAEAAIGGIVDDLPTPLTYLDLSGSASVVGGEFPNIEATVEHFDISGTDCEFIAFISNFPASIEHFDVSGSQVSVFGDIEDAPASLIYFDASNTGSAVTAASQETGMTTGLKFVDLSDIGLGSSAVDDIIIALSTVPSWVSPKTLDIGGNNAPRTSASDEAKSVLEGLGVTVTVNETSPVISDITDITASSNFENSATSVTVTKPTGTADNDTMVALCYLDGQDTSGTWTAPAGWTRIFDFTGSTGRVRYFSCFRKLASSEGSDYTFTHSGSATQCSAGIIKMRGPDATTPLDVTYVEANHALNDGTEPFTCPSITTITDKSLVLMMQGITHNFCTAGGAPSGYTLQLEQIGDQDGQILMATKVVTTAGTENPGDWTSTFSDNSGYATTFALAIKPANTGDVITEPTAATLANNQAAGDANITITTSDASTYKVDWGDGTISGEIASGVSTSHTYASAYDGDVVINSDGDVTQIVSTAGGWDFAATAVPSTCTVLNLANSDAAITGTLAQLPTGLTDLQLQNTSSALTGDFGDEPSGMVTMYLANSSCVIGGEIGDAASTLTNLTLRLTDSDANFNLSTMPAAMRHVRVNDSNCTVDGSAGTILASAFDVAEFHNLALTESVVDDILISFANITTWTGSARIEVGGTNAERSTDSNTAVTTLEGNGVTVNANGPVEPGTGDPPPIDPPPTNRVGIVYTSSVENGVVYQNSAGDDGWRTDQLHPNEPYKSQCFKILQSTDTDGITPREGNYCMRFHWERNWPMNGVKVRAELYKPGAIQYYDGDEFWMGWSIYLPNDAVIQQWVNSNLINQSVTQFHNEGTGGSNHLYARSGRWEFAFGGLGKQFCGNITLGQWTDFVLHAKVSRTSSGFAKLWINAASDADTPIYNRTGVTLGTGVNFLYHKAGIYNGNLDPIVVDYITQYHDAYRIGNQNSNFNSVKPG